MEQTVEEFTAHAKGIESLRKSRLTVPEQPVGPGGKILDPRLPSDISSADPARLGRLMSEFTAMADYISYVAALADIEATTAEHVLEYLSASVRLEKSGTVQDKNDKTLTDPRVREATKHHFATMAKARLTAVLLANYERDLSAVSREITRRGNEWKRT